MIRKAREHGDAMSACVEVSGKLRQPDRRTDLLRLIVLRVQQDIQS